MNLLNISLTILIVVGLLLYAFGLQKKSQMMRFIGGLAFLTPILYFIGWAILLPLVPGIVLGISYFGKKKVESA